MPESPEHVGNQVTPRPAAGLPPPPGDHDGQFNRPKQRLPWYLFAGGMATFAVGDAFYYTLPKLLHRSPPPFPSIGDFFYLLVYPLLIAGVLLLIRQRNPGRDAVGLIDALIVTTAVGLMAWVFLI